MKKFSNACFYDSASTKHLEWVQHSSGVDCLEQGKNRDKLRNKLTIDLDPIEPSEFRKGVFFYLWSKPLTNYYHTMLDSVGCLTRYYSVLEEYPNTVLLINRTPRMKLNSYPPFVTELLDLLGIRYEYTYPTTQYETVYFGDTGAQNPNTLKRIQPGAD